LTNNGIILLVEDDADLNNANRRALILRQYTVHIALTLAEARERLGETEPDIILLDIMLPDGDGFSFCNEIRKKTQAHIIFLTAKAEHEDMVRGLSTGGDDYITKPFHAGELLARVESAMRRRKMDRTPAKTLSVGNLTLDVVSGQALVGGEDLQLSQKEFNLLLLFVQNESETMNASYIYEKVWGTPMVGNRNALQTAISKLRKKIESTGYDIVAVRKQGYQLEKI